MLVAIQTAMPEEPFTNKLGKRLGALQYTDTLPGDLRPRNQNYRVRLPTYTAWRSPGPGAPAHRKPTDLHGDGSGPTRRRRM